MGKIRSFFRLHHHHHHRSKHQPGGSHADDAPSSVVADPGNLERVFNKFDSNGDGKISSAELAAVLESLGGHPPSQEELARMMLEADGDGDGFISLAEFVDLNSAASAAEEEDLRLAFSVFDLDRSGAISADEIARVLSGIGEGATLAQCRRMINGVDRDGDGLVSFEEFKAMMTAGGGSAQAFAVLAAAKAGTE